MIQLEAVRIEEFRGIRTLELPLNGKSYAVWGPNGTGKSGVVDAIDFALTGDISRLRGPGSKGLTVAKHAPHVHKRNDPAAARVTVTVLDTASGKTAHLTRTVKNAGSYTLEPEVAEVRSAIDRVAQHPEVVLSRREIIKFIIAEPGKRADEVQALLKLDRLGDLRSALRTAKTNVSRSKTSASAAVSTATEALKRHFDLPSLLGAEVLARVNMERAKLGLATFESLNVPDLADGVTGVEPSPVSKETAIRDADALAQAISDPTALESAVTQLNAAIAPVIEDPALLREADRRQLVEAGLGLLDGKACPLCDHEWSSADELRTYLGEKLSRSKFAGEVYERIKKDAHAVSNEVKKVVSTAQVVVQTGGALNKTDVAETLVAWVADLEGLRKDLTDPEAVLATQERLGADPLQATASVIDSLAELRQALADLPDVGEAATATKFLTVAQERYAALRASQASLKSATTAADAADVVYDTFCASMDNAFTQLYKKVEEEFCKYYKRVNADEQGFKAELAPSSGKLDLSVDFYELGMFPPAAYHSEGHQDGMGVCLYLALMKQLLGDDFRLAILDDVIMSVDAGHRRQFCDLLQSEFPDVQFLITTHDEIWARQMQRSKLITRANQAHFVQWDVDRGPVVAKGSDLWDDIDTALAANDVSRAAAGLRRGLEMSLGELADEYRAPIPFSAAGSYELGDLLNGVKRRWKDLLGEAADAANSWTDKNSVAAVKTLKERWKLASEKQDTEHWAVNPAVHFNEWATFSKADFEPVVTAWKEFFNAFECGDCNSRFYVTYHDSEEDALRCDAGHLNLNLRKKS